MRYNLTTNHRLITGLAAGLTFASAMAMAPSAVEAGGSPAVTPFAECQNGSPVMGFEVTNGIGYTYYLGGNAFAVTTSPAKVTMTAEFDEPTSATMSSSTPPTGASRGWRSMTPWGASSSSATTGWSPLTPPRRTSAIS